MPVSALIITVHGKADQPALRAQMAKIAGLELGEAQALRWPAVTETDSLEQGRELLERVQALSGVVHVDVLSVNFEDIDFDNLDVGGVATSGTARANGISKHG